MDVEMMVVDFYLVFERIAVYNDLAGDGGVTLDS